MRFSTITAVAAAAVAGLPAMGAPVVGDYSDLYAREEEMGLIARFRHDPPPRPPTPPTPPNTPGEQETSPL